VPDTTNPLTKAHQAIWTVLEAYSGFTSVVPAGNRIKYDQAADRSPEKPKGFNAHYPKVRVRQGPSKFHASHCSSGSRLRQWYLIDVQTGDQRVGDEDNANDGTLNPVRWAIYRALMDWSTTMTALTWNSKQFIFYATTTDAKDVLSLKQRKQRNGWQTEFVFEVDMFFTRSDLPPAS